MKRILVLNNYPLDRTWDEVRRKQAPDHLLYGINHFYKRGYDVEIVPYKTSKFLGFVTHIAQRMYSLLPLGDIDQQYSVIRRLNSADLIYAPCQTATYLLSYLRALKIIKVPLVCIAHHPIDKGRLVWLRYLPMKLIVKGTDAFPGLSRKVSEMIAGYSGKDRGKSRPLLMGPDSKFYPAEAGAGEGTIAVGRTGRDFHTFGVAAARSSIKAKIICVEGSLLGPSKDFGGNVKVTCQDKDSYMAYPQLMKICAKTRVHAIPLFKQESLNGLSSLLDAMGLGKPVIMTRNPFIDIDIEKEGIGMWVEPYDVEGWVKALKFFEENEDEALAMGRRARGLVDKGLNSESFANQIMDIFDKVLSQPINTNDR